MTPLERSVPVPTADVLIISMAESILVMVTGHRTPENLALVDEVRDALQTVGASTQDIEVLWS